MRAAAATVPNASRKSAIIALVASFAPQCFFVLLAITS